MSIVTAASALASLFCVRSPGHWNRRTSGGAAAAGHRHVHEPHGLGRGPAVGAGHARHGDTEIRPEPCPNPLGHRDGHLGRHGPVSGEHLPGHAKLRHLDGIRVGDHPATEVA